MNNLLKTTLAGALVISILACENTHEAHDSTPSTAAIPAITHDALFVVNGGSNSLSVINTETDNIAGTIALKNAKFPHHISLSADKQWLALAVPGADLSGGHSHTGHTHVAGMFMIIKAQTGEMKSFKTLPEMNHNAVFSPKGDGIWTTQMIEDGTVKIFNANSLDEMSTISVGSAPAEVTFSHNGKYAFVANSGSNSVSVIDPALKTVVKTISVGSGPVGAWAGSDNVMYVDNETGKSITAIDASTLEVTRTYQLGFTPAMAMNVGQELWVTDTQNGKVVIFKTDSDEKIREIATGAGAHAIAFNANKTKAYITNQSANTVSVIDVEAKNVLKTISVGSKPNGAVFRAK
ncbi:MAG TPA: YncE family protein [Patescibacteria group bacterium]|nr:YncE family protein [Patescibacteria group bacterium]